jgi:hypothetical protein
MTVAAAAVADGGTSTASSIAPTQNVADRRLRVTVGLYRPDPERRPRPVCARYRDPIEDAPPDGTTESHWVRWHRSYDVDGSPLRLRLAIVQQFLRDAIEASPPGKTVQVLSLCAGRGTDVIDVLADHPRARDVRARLVELDPDLAAGARVGADTAGLAQVEVVTGDASTTDAAVGAVPADVLLACGIFGNVSAADIRHFVECAPALCAAGATVIWTRHRRPPDRTVDIREWFASAGFDELGFTAPDPAGLVAVGAHRLVRDPDRFRGGQRLFTFVGDGRPS